MIFKFFHPVFTGGTIFLSVLERRVLFIGNLSEEVPCYWQFKRGGTILLGKFGRRFIEFFLMSITLLAVGWSFILMVLVILLVWPKIWVTSFY